MQLAKTQTPCGSWLAGLAGLRKQGFRMQTRLATQHIYSPASPTGIGALQTWLKTATMRPRSR
ncbi:hypothetical protein XANMN_23820 [Xanthomonas phaseoli pv. manihotis str. CIO151]|nr:hypothetical protein XANMN_23820 [Xanthomonas phaseoli pv. manihotis str. CIO151]